MILAYECYADHDVFLFLRGHGRSLQSYHAGGQGEVINAVLVKQSADIGMVDEDPQSSHHRRRDEAQLVRATHDLVWRRAGDRHIVIVKPDLEGCFLAGVRRLNLASSLPSNPNELRAVLNIPGHSKHLVFQEELDHMNRESQRRGVTTFVSELEEIVRRLSQT